MAFVGFNAKTVPPATGSTFELLPKGRYLGVCTETEIKTNSAKTGEYLKLTFELIEGSYKGRKLFEQLNIRHPNPKAVEIALSQLSSLCHAIDVMEVADSSALHNIPVLLEVGIEKGRDGYEDRNRIYSYLSAKSGASIPPPKTATGLPPLTPWASKPYTGPAIEDDVPF